MSSFKLSLCSRLALVLFCSLSFPAPRLSAELPTPISVLGHNPGDDFYLADYEDTIKYFHALASATDRMKMITLGKTSEGRVIEAAIISSPKNLAALDETKQAAGRLAHATDLNDDTALALARSSKVIVH